MHQHYVQYQITTNSYKRLVPGFEAPVNVCWGLANRSTAIRVPMYNRN